MQLEKQQCTLMHAVIAALSTSTANKHKELYVAAVCNLLKMSVRVGVKDILHYCNNRLGRFAVTLVVKLELGILLLSATASVG
eukprot:8520-Heterococcus_DN1.PRE.9